jgi:hypothetical protein
MYSSANGRSSPADRTERQAADGRGESRIISENLNLAGLKPAEEARQVEAAEAPVALQLIQGRRGQQIDRLPRAVLGHIAAGKGVFGRQLVQPGYLSGNSDFTAALPR